MVFKFQHIKTETIRQKVLGTIHDFNMLDRGDKILVAVSGGPDSVMLLHLLQDLAPMFALTLGISHVNHGLRPVAADSEALAVERLAQKHNLPFHIYKVKLDNRSGSLEEKARQVRYTFFHETAAASGYTKIALGHQADDNAEAVLMNLMRGSGTRGLAGIPACREGRIIRPLIRLRRPEILRYLKQHNLSYAEDLSNLDRRFARNWVRHDLIPLIQRNYNTDLVTTLNRMADLCRDEEDWFESYLQPVLNAAVLADDTRLKLSLSILNAQPPALQRRLLRQALRRRMGHLRRISVLHIEALREMLSPNPKHRAVCLPGGIRALRLDDTIQFETAGRPESLQIPPDKMSAVEVTPVLDKTIVVNLDRFCCSLKFTLKNHSTMLSLPHNAKNEAVFDAGLISLPLTIRSFRPGDRLQPFGMRGSKKVKDLFIDLKIPRSQRVTIPLLIGNDRILWVAGLRRSAGAPVTPATRRVLHVACTPAILC